MHQRGGPERVARQLTTQVAVGDTPKLFVHDRKNGVEVLVIGAWSLGHGLGWGGGSEHEIANVEPHSTDAHRRPE